ncbi:LamG-like jellyroll fold domain-containing protein [Mariniblastus fucicola]|uniref:FecR protein n=1 Tax=Mariniblastus fucicola TaxID=980251 RepID=A0A5B9P757_9BACT|nr:LamG-like jellyroll fold domain-containing protein [Mariniblastus fucicola]QEG22457.1 FecR protein [Mariniblastus fucicola]
MNDSLRDELESLLFDWDAGTLGDAGIDRVREILRSDESARAAYLQHQLLNAAMGLDASSRLDADSGTISQVSEPELDLAKQNIPSALPSDHFFRVSLWAVAATTLLFCGLLGRLAYLEFSDSDTVAATEAIEEVTSSGVALVTQLVDVEFEPDQVSLDVGDALMPGPIAIKSGFAQIEFFCGATLIVEGPAEIDLKSSVLASVTSGKFRAQVPPAARGFSIEVDDMKVVDLGTEFGLAVTENGADIQVFDGEIEVHSPQSDKRLLTTGQAIVRNSVGEFSTGKITPDRFVDIASMESRADGQQTQRYEAWKTLSNRLSRDPRVVAYYSFDEQGAWDRKLHSSVRPDNDELDGAIVGAGKVNGRWPAKSGLEFKRPGDRVRVRIPGEFDSLTFACWVKIDSLDRWYNSLFLTDNYNEGEPHWQILDTGQLFFSVRHKPDDLNGQPIKGPTHQEVLSPPFWKPSMSGRWLHLATTYDADAGKTTHYLNGERIHEETIADQLVVRETRIGAASIGNWSIPTKPDAEFAVRNLNGSMDEFMILSDALSENEIREIYESGKP